MYELIPDQMKMKKRVLKDRSSTTNNKEWQAKIDKKIRRSKEIILENDLEMKVACLKQRVGVIIGAKSDPAK